MMTTPTRPTRGFLLFLVLLMVAIWGAQILMAEQMCRVRAEPLKLEHNWTRATGCQVNIGGRWLPIDQVRVRP